MINRGNYLLARAYLSYLADVQGNTPQTVVVRRHHLDLLLEWADDHPLQDAAAIAPEYRKWLSARAGKDGAASLSASYLIRACATARHFLEWLGMEEDFKYSVRFLATISYPLPDSAIPNPSAYSVPDISRMLSIQSSDLGVIRDQAAAAFLFLSGMRVGAFVTMSIRSVDMARRQVDQSPALGVCTKGGKAARTFLLPIPDLLSVVTDWDNRVRRSLPETAMWYAGINSDSTGFSGMEHASVARQHAVADGLGRLCELAGLPYLSPHKLRHGHARWGLEHARELADYKAISQNLMHSSLNTTDSIYAVLEDRAIQDRIARMGTDAENPDMMAILAKIAAAVGVKP